mmetsp:Transcript_17310/g.53785  ORF Transcript_17310/g.53785 Transcript_17310/m.53785 type:complete len:236 (+) Transcript_17310:204-911(+)
MLRHELCKHVLLLLLLGRGQPELLLPLVVHHLLDRLARLAVEVREVGVLGLDFLRVDLGVADEDTFPPLHAVDLLKREAHLAVVLHCPQAVVRLHLCVQLAINDGRLPLEANTQRPLLDANGELLGARALGHGHKDRDIAQRLRPPVLVRDPAVEDRLRSLALLVGGGRAVVRGGRRRGGGLRLDGLVGDILEALRRRACGGLLRLLLGDALLARLLVRSPLRLARLLLGVLRGE